ncbi:MAG TPA: bifunctional nuclease family protein [Chloroflexota bacterium]|nr:bifunctional nuclease family protein [Chloroflexota bacterium]
MFVEMAVHALAVSTEGGPCAIILRGLRLPVMLPIAIASPQAAAIAAVRFEFRRPLTHDLILAILDELRGSLERVVIHDVKGSTFISRLELSKDGAQHELDCRPSDAIALAVRLNTPILVTADVLARAEGVRWGKSDETEADATDGKERTLGQARGEAGSRASGPPGSIPLDAPMKPNEPQVSPEQLAPFKEVIETLDLENL